MGHGGTEGWGPKGAGAQPRKSGGPKGGDPEGGDRRVGGPKRGRPKISPFFPSPAPPNSTRRPLESERKTAKMEAGEGKNNDILGGPAEGGPAKGGSCGGGSCHMLLLFNGSLLQQHTNHDPFDCFFVLSKSHCKKVAYWVRDAVLDSRKVEIARGKSKQQVTTLPEGEHEKHTDIQMEETKKRTHDT